MNAAPEHIPPDALALLKALATGPQRTKGRRVAVSYVLARSLAERRGNLMCITEAGRALLLDTHIVESSTDLDRFRRQHLQLETRQLTEDRVPKPVLANAAESPLVWLARRKGRDGRTLIDTVQLQAGERLRTDFTAAQMTPRVTSSWGGAIGARGGRSAAVLHHSESAVAARQRVNRALDSAGPEFAGLLLDVCCFLKGLEDVERERNWPARSGKIVLQLGLDRLARHYGYGARGGEQHAIRRWTAPLAEPAAG